MVSTVGTLLTVRVLFGGLGVFFLIETISEEALGFGSWGKDE